MKTIVWDVDDVLNDLTRVWFETSWQREHPESAGLRYEDLTENPPHRILRCSLADYLASLDAFRSSEAAALPPREELLRWLERHGAAFRHVALTAVPAFAAPISAAWVMRHYGRWIRLFGFVPSPRPGDNFPIYDESKAAFLQQLAKADFFVDDRPDNLEGARDLGIVTLTEPRPWNKATESPLERLIP